MSTEEQEVCDHCAGEHLGSCRVDNTLAALSKNLRNSFQGTSRWSISDTTAGLFKVYNLHALNGATDTITNATTVKNRDELEEMLEWMRWSKAAYNDENKSPATILELSDKDLVKMVTNSGVHKPAFFIGIHHTRKCVVMAIRGTHQKQDVFTDLNPNTEQFLQGFAHSGMLEAARWLFENEGKTLQSLLEKYPGYRLVLTGHSLGAATAGLLAMIIRSTEGWYMPKEQSSVPSSKILCWGYGCAPCVDRELAESSTFICNVVLQDDIVARVSPAAVEALRNEILGTSWSQVVTDQTTKRLLETMVQVHGSFGTILSTGSSFLATGAQAAGAALFQKIGNFRTAYASTSSSNASIVDRLSVSASVSEKIGITTKNDSTGVPDTEIAAESALNVVTTTPQQGIDQPETAHAPQSQTNTTTTDGEESESTIADKTVMAVATGSSANMEELERRRLYVPGVLYHIKRLRRYGERRMSLPTSPKALQGASGEDSSSAPMYVVVRGMDPKERFGRIIVSRTIISDHSCPSYLQGISGALSSCSNA
ncbi:hypothetical protein M758_3G083600 [Ceratodon purpureus]|nr:hypothetical protein M758_3G083600 [Ceratodon purpureus]